MKTLICFVLTLLTASAMAQDPTPPVVTEPFIVPHAPAFSRWTVSYVYSGKQGTSGDASSGDGSAGSQQKNLLQQRLVVKTGSVRMEQMVYPATQGERWQHNSEVVVRDAFTNKITVDPPTPVESEVDFSEFAWINQNNLKGVRTIDGTKCVVFEEKIDPTILSTPRYHPDAASKIDPQMLVVATAIINFDNRLPISLKGGNLTLKYAFLPTPTEVLSIPSAFTDVLRQYEQQRKILHAPLSPP